MKTLKKIFFVGLFILTLTGVAFAQGANPMGAIESASLETAGGSCTGCSGWVWVHTQEAWRYVSGSEERIWLYFTVTHPAYAVVDTGDARHIMFIESASSAHYLGLYWTSATTFSNVRLWYY